MKFIVKFFPEITIKSASVRWYFIKILTNNIRCILKLYACNTTVKYHWDYIEILIHEYTSVQDIAEALVRIPGIHHILLVKEYFFNDTYDIFNKIIDVYNDTLIGKSFCVRVKQYGQNNFTSKDLECFLGDMLCKNIKNSFVKLVGSDEIISIEIRKNNFLLLKNRYNGLGGFPIGSQGSVISLISGGFDSGIASYMFVRRGCKVHYCFFKIGSNGHEVQVYELAYFIWKKFGCSHLVKFISVDFSFVLDEIFNKIDQAYRGVVLKRMMIRAASFVAKCLNVSALVTGEVIGQVSSQTLINLNVINNVTDIMIFRPLISYDKEDIISLSRKIDIEQFVVNIPEYCGVVSKKPTINASKQYVEIEEKKFNFSILYNSVSQRKVSNIDNIFSQTKKKLVNNIRFINQLTDGYVIIDIRDQQEQKNNPLCLDMVQIEHIPFYKLFNIFSTLDKNKVYLLYCGRGIMSHWGALRLRDHGFKNVHVYLPL